MILSDREIRLAIARRSILLSPLPVEDAWSSTAIDLRLDAEVREWMPRQTDPNTGNPVRFCPGDTNFSVQHVIQTQTVPHDLRVAAYLFLPGRFILGWTMEKLRLPHEARICARVEGKSSLARLGLGVHVTAPTVHAGFGSGDDPEGNSIQLEIWNAGPLPIELRYEMPICQLIFEEVHGTLEKGYRGQFLDQGPKPT